MFGIGMPELIVLLVIALIVIGPKKLPELAKSLGRAMGEFKKATRDLKRVMDVEEEMSDVKKAFNDISTQAVAEPPPKIGEKAPSQADGQDPETDKPAATGAPDKVAVNTEKSAEPDKTTDKPSESQ